jgi:hypothetical protein
MESKWATIFYRLVYREIRDGVEIFLSRVLGDEWIDLLNENATARHEKEDPRSSLLLLSRPNFVRSSVCETLEKESSREAKDAAISVRRVITQIAHFRPVSDRQILYAMHAADQLLTDIKQDERASKVSEFAHALWAESFKKKDVPDNSVVVPGKAEEARAAPYSDITASVPSESDDTRNGLDVRVGGDSPTVHPDAAVDIDAGNEGDCPSHERPEASQEIAKPAAESPDALGTRSVQPSKDQDAGSSGMIVPPEWQNPDRRKQGARPEPAVLISKPGIDHRGRRVALVLGVLVTLIAIVFYVSGPHTQDDPQVDATSTQPQPPLPPAIEVPQAERLDVVLGVEKVASAYPIPNGQREIIIKPAVGNAANQTVQLRRNQMRLLVEDGSFDPLAWLPPGRASTAGVPVLVSYGGRNVWSIPMNDTGMFEQMAGGKNISWATIFYDGTDGYEWDIDPSQQVAKAWQLTFYIPETLQESQIVGFGVVDVEGQRVASAVPISEWPEFGCVCDWWA